MDYRGPFQIRDGVFNRNWVSAPATPPGRDGLGPTYNATSCSACHDNNGRGAPPQGDEPFLGLLLRLSVDGMNEDGGPQPDPVYGDQLQPYAILGVPAEGTPRVTYTEQPGTYADGEPYSLRAPTYSVDDPKFGPLADGILISPRLAPQMVGLGLLEAVDEETINGFAATNGGHPNHVWDVAKQATVLGRFGWKANQPTLAQQTFAAFRNDIGITSELFPDKSCGPTQTDCLDAPMSLTIPNIQDPQGERHGGARSRPGRTGAPESGRRSGAPRGTAVRPDRLRKLPHSKDGDRCASGLAGAVESDHPPLHGSVAPRHEVPTLADGRPDFEATGKRAQMPPLWGLGLSGVIDGYLFLKAMHDGRARNFAEAILWHGGQAKTASEPFLELPKGDRDSLVAFLQSL